MKTMFDKITLGGIPVRNRFVRSATFEHGGDENGHFQNNMYDITKALAEGGVGLIITGMVSVDEYAGINKHMIKAFDESFVPGLQKLTALVHRYDSKIVVQIAHVGVKVNKEERNLPIMAVSNLPDEDYTQMTVEDIFALVESFAATAVRCKEAGADGIQLHSAHGYLLNQFLSPVFNHRTDEYGGAIQNRARVVFDIYKAVREAVGIDYPVWIKINSSDLIENGLTSEESLWVCKQLSEMGIDAIEVSGGLSISSKTSPVRKIQNQQEENYFLNDALIISKQLNADVISVGGYRTPEMFDEIINKGNIKAISLSRPLICEPNLINRWDSGDLTKAKCISCNKCFRTSPLGCKVFS